MSTPDRLTNDDVPARMPGVVVRFHTCPVCRREICATGGVIPLFSRHNDKAGTWCPMSGQPIPEWDGS